MHSALLLLCLLLCGCVVASGGTSSVYGRIIIPPGEYGAFLASGSTDYTGNSADLANIYIPADDYDTWRQRSSEPTRGSFTYQIRNETLTCLVIEVRWGFNLQEKPGYMCAAALIASNWDCHLKWALDVTVCAFDERLRQLNATYVLKREN